MLKQTTTIILCFLFCNNVASSWQHGGVSPSCASRTGGGTSSLCSATKKLEHEHNTDVFDDFCAFLIQQQSDIISQLEDMDGSSDAKAKFTRDCWGKFDTNGSSSSSSTRNGGITRVMQGGTVIEKGACSLTIIEQGILSQERAATIQSRQDNNNLVSIHEGDTYSAAALSIVLHSRSPLVPTFRSDVRIFVVTSSADKDGTTGGGGGDGATTPTTVAWFGGGADLTPYYLNDEDVTQFHAAYQTLANAHDLGEEEFTYHGMKKACDDYFYLPARSEHRGTGGIFFDDLWATSESLDFVKGVARAWVPSWKPIVDKHRNVPYTEQQRHWQLLRRGRYLEFNLLYDRGVKFGLAAANPRVEGVMVSAPPLIAWEYNHVIEQGSPEAKLMEVLKTPRAWV